MSRRPHAADSYGRRPQRSTSAPAQPRTAAPGDEGCTVCGFASVWHGAKQRCDPEAAAASDVPTAVLCAECGQPMTPIMKCERPDDWAWRWLFGCPPCRHVA